jgi:hypothetical protein
MLGGPGSRTWLSRKIKLSNMAKIKTIDALPAPRPKASARVFPSAQDAREAIRAQLAEVIEMYRDNIKLAIAAGDHEAAAKAMQWLMEHAPADAAGQRPIETSVDKQPKQVEKGPAGPMVQIGFQLGGIGAKAPLTTIEVSKVEPKAIEGEVEGESD